MTSRNAKAGEDAVKLLSSEETTAMSGKYLLAHQLDISDKQSTAALVTFCKVRHSFFSLGSCN
jgi:hypothetical protein